MASMALFCLSVPPTPTPKTLTPKFHHHRSNLTPPFPHQLRPPLPLLLRRSRTPKFIVSASYNSTPVPDRLISAVAYFLPFFNGLQYGRFLFSHYPRTLGAALQPLLPLLSAYRSVPFGSYIAFMALYAGVVRNQSFSRYVRFNAMQAVVLDVLLSVPMLLQHMLLPNPKGVAFKVMEMSHNVIFVFIVVCFAYSLSYSVLGRTPVLPFVADAAGRQF